MQNSNISFPSYFQPRRQIERLSNQIFRYRQEISVGGLRFFGENEFKNREKSTVKTNIACLDCQCFEAKNRNDKLLKFKLPQKIHFFDCDLDCTISSLFLEKLDYESRDERKLPSKNILPVCFSDKFMKELERNFTVKKSSNIEIHRNLQKFGFLTQSNF